MSEQANVALLEEAYAQWKDSKAGGVQHWLDLMADDIDFWSIADGAPGMEFSERCSCMNDVGRYFELLARDWELIRFDIGEYIAQGDRVVVLGDWSWRNRRSGAVCNSPKVDVVRFRDRRIVSFHEYYDTAKALAAARG